MYQSLLESEPLFKTREPRLSLIPVSPEFSIEYSLYKLAIKSFWTVEEFNYEKDAKDWPKLDRDSQEFIENMFAFFSGGDYIVNDNLALNFYKEFDIPEIRAFYANQIFMETIHSETYGFLIDKLITEPERRKELFESFKYLPHIKKLYLWAKKWISYDVSDELLSSGLNPELAYDRDLAHIWSRYKRLVAFACVEGIMFSGPFAAIYWIREQGIMDALTGSNNVIARDEGLHTIFACQLLSRFVHKPDASSVLSIVKEAVEASQEFITESIDKLNGMTSETMNQYIEYVGDGLLARMGYPKHYSSSLPSTFSFMEKISYDGQSNFFEKRSTEYAVSAEASVNIVLSDDF